MVKISEAKINRIKSNILSILFENFPKSLFTSEISELEARDEEFIKRLLEELEEKRLVVAVKKNPKGKQYEKRIRWRISNRVYNVYKKLAEKGIEVY